MTLPAAPPITHAGMTRPRFSVGRLLGPPRLLVIHATAGDDSLGYLRRGGDEKPVSAHYLVSKAGQIWRLVNESDTAWHCGKSVWSIDGRPVGGSLRGTARLNWLSIGVELENRNDGRDPYPDSQLAALLALSHWIVARHRIPRDQVARHLDIAPGRKTDPAGLLWSWLVSALFPASGGTATIRDDVEYANVRQGPGRGFPVALGGMAVMWPGQILDYDAITDGEAIAGDSRWLHRRDGVGFVHASLIAERSEL